MVKVFWVRSFIPGVRVARKVPKLMHENGTEIIDPHFGPHPHCAVLLHSSAHEVLTRILDAVKELVGTQMDDCLTNT